MNYLEEKDENLVNFAKTGNTDAFEELMSRHKTKIYLCSLKVVHNEADASDISQRTWIKGWQQLKQFRSEASFPSWMTRIAINFSLDHIRKQKRLKTKSLDEINENNGGIERQLLTTITESTTQLELKELQQEINYGLSQLSIKQRVVIKMYGYEELTYKEIAKKAGCSIGTVMSRLFYARRRLAGLLANLNPYLEKN